jgi:cation-transporting P-type ATPase E
VTHHTSRTLPKGLSTQEVEHRIATGKTNATDTQTSRSVSDIIRANVLTRLNAIVVIMMVAVLSTGSILDASFGVAAILNSIIGIFQELRAKRTLDRLAILHAPQATVVRDGRSAVIPAVHIVQDDTIQLKTGDQISADGTIIDAEGLEINESLLTGEVEPIAKKRHQTVHAGSFVVAGQGYMQATAVGAATYVHDITRQAKRFSIVRSELVEGTNKLLTYITWILLAVAPLIIVGQILLSKNGWKEALVRSMAAIDGMIPQGLVLLTSLSFMLATLALARRKVLIQQLPAVEGLARVDVICLDKTGTLTEGAITFDKLDLLDTSSKDSVTAVLRQFAADPQSPTMQALHEAFPGRDTTTEYTVPFSSARKWSALAHDGRYWLLGAPEMIIGNDSHAVRKQAAQAAAEGKRVLLLVSSKTAPTVHHVPADIQPAAIVILGERIRADAHKTLAFFAKQGVALKVISGDSPHTVGAIAAQVGITAPAIDARTLPSDTHKLAEIVASNHVFGRVTPNQKQAMVAALQSQGHVVAMTGDGVNDVLALKDADIGIAMGNGSPATKAIAELVLLDNKFSRMPDVLSEGRRVIANIERVASLFIVKNVYSLVLVLALTALAFPYTFLPRHLTILSAFTIGIPAFFLALAPNNKRYVPGFLSRVLRFSIPAGGIMAALLLLNYILLTARHASLELLGTTSSIIVMLIGLWIIICLARPFKVWKASLVIMLCASFAVILAWPTARQLAGYQLMQPYISWSLLAGAAGCVGIELLWRKVGQAPQLSTN